MFFLSKTKNTTIKQTALKRRTLSVIKWDRHLIKLEVKNAVSVFTGENNSKNDSFVSILPFLRRDTSNNGGFLA
jgi:hypothetical protein